MSHLSYYDGVKRSVTMTKTRIVVKSLSGKILTYNVDEYEIKDGLIVFYDNYEKIKKSYPASNCEIQEIVNEVKK